MARMAIKPATVTGGAGGRGGGRRGRGAAARGVAAAQGAHGYKAGDEDRGDGGLGGAAEDDVGVATPDQVKAKRHHVRPAGAGERPGYRRPLPAEDGERAG